MMPDRHGLIHRKHTPIVSRAQQRLFGAVRAGRATKATGLSKAEAGRHLTESKGKKLPARRSRLTRRGRSAA